MTHAPTTDGWRRSFTDRSLSQFAEQFADEIVLEATTLAKPVKGKHSVAAVLATANSIYESLEFTAEAQSASTTYLQWRATAFGGIQIDGVTVLERDVSSKTSQPPSTIGRWAPCCDSRPRSSIDSPA
jgi:hypothetical protein